MDEWEKNQNYICVLYTLRSSDKIYGTVSRKLVLANHFKKNSYWYESKLYTRDESKDLIVTFKLMSFASNKYIQGIELVRGEIKSPADI